MPPMAVHRGGEVMELPERDVTPFGVLLENRCSRRKYDGGPLTLEELSFLLWAAQGVKRVAEHYTVRTAPSGGAKPGGGCDCPSGTQVRRASSSQVRRTSSSVASWWVEWVRARSLPFFAASSAAFAASSAFELAFLGAIAGGFFVARMVGAKCWNLLSRAS